MSKLMNAARRAHAALGAPVYLAVLQLMLATLLLWPLLQRLQLDRRSDPVEHLLRLLNASSLIVLPQLLVALGLALMTVGLLLRARVAWSLTALLLVAAAVLSRLGPDRSDWALGGALLLLAALLQQWRRFDRASLAAGGLFALLSIGSLLVYAVFGVLYLGAEFQPPIEDLTTALYFSIVSMSTVGYGDISPHTATARLFTASIIVLGITVFATSIGAVIGPVIGGSLKRIVKGGISSVIRKDHYLIVGASPIALSVHEGLRRRGYPVAVLIPPNLAHGYPAGTDIVLGDPADPAVLRQAGAHTAHTVLALRTDDAENAFTVLAIRDLAPAARTVVLVNDARNLQRLRLLKPDIVFSPQQLAGELLARSLNGETIDNALVTELLFG